VVELGGPQPAIDLGEHSLAVAHLQLAPQPLERGVVRNLEPLLIDLRQQLIFIHHLRHFLPLRSQQPIQLQHHPWHPTTLRMATTLRSRHRLGLPPCPPTEGRRLTTDATNPAGAAAFSPHYYFLRT
jgi:hypothetical protein